MKNTILKSIFALVIAFMELPVMGQDYMNIYFKNGDFRKFYLENVTEITTSKIDANGVLHSDIDYQHITTIYDRYVYSLEDIECIRFAKINEEQSEKNFVSAMTVLFPIIKSCESIYDIERKIDIIKNVEGIEKAWCDGHQLFVAIAQDAVYSFHFNHDGDLTERNLIAQIRALKPRLANIVKSDGSQLKAVIVNQQHNDEHRNHFIDEEYLPLKNTFLSCGIAADYVPSPTIDFFYDNCQNPEDAEHLNIYDYDIIFLVTHGSYDDIYFLNEHWYGDKVSSYNLKGHGISSSEVLFMVESASQDADDQPHAWVDYYHRLKKWRKDNSYKDATDLQINVDFNHEQRNNQWYWVAHPTLTEFFFRDIAQGHFSNPNSVFFNSACQSLKGDNNSPSDSFAEKMFAHGLGLYMGYTETDSYGKRCAPELFSNMLKYNWSLEKAYQELPKYYQEETVDNIKEEGITLTTEEEIKLAENLEGAQLRFVYNHENREMSSNLFILPPHTEEIDNEKATREYNQSTTVTVNGEATFLSFDDNVIKAGFAVTFYDPVGNTQYVDAEIDPICYENNVYKFSTKLENLERNRTYQYSAYTYDGINYNYGNVCSFKIDKLNELMLSTNSISLYVGWARTIDITSGNGSYSIEVIESTGVVTASIIENHISIEALAVGSATITVKDDKSGETANIEVNVLVKDIPAEAIDLGLPSGTLWASFNVGATKPEEYGGYYAWGETEEKDFYDENTYSYSEKNIGDNIAGTEYDVAHTKWGGSWQMPTKRLLQELFKCCSFEWTTVNGVEGGKLTGPNGNSIFLPAGQLKIGYGSTGTQYGAYWSSEKGLGWRFYMGTNDVFSCSTYEGLLVRPVIPGITGDIPGKAIDLGLPSGTKWASYNVGATAPDDYGGYYAWGETEEKDSYDLSNYNHCDGTDNTYHNLGESIIGTEYDVATVKWGSQWHMPTKEQFEELINNCSVVFGKTKNGVYGIQFTGPNGNKIFLPAAGCKVKQSSPNHLEGKYLTGQLTKWDDYVADSMCDILSFDKNSPSMYYGTRYWGVPVRPVTNQ